MATLNDATVNKALAQLRAKLARQQEAAKITEAQIELYESIMRGKTATK